MSAAMSLLNLVLLLILAVGNGAVIVAFVNRLHGRPLPEPFLKNVRHAHDATILLLPLLLVGLLGLSGPRLLLGGQWSDISTAWRIYVAVCSIGVLLLAVIGWLVVLGMLDSWHMWKQMKQR